MSKTTIKKETEKILHFAYIRHKTRPIAFYFSDYVDTSYCYKWNGETTFAHFFNNIPEKPEEYCLSFTGVIWFENGDYAQVDSNKENYYNYDGWNYHHVPKLEDYFDVVTE